jgi:hypothetical protein
MTGMFEQRQKAGKPPAFAGGFGSGAVLVLEEMYTSTVTVSNKLS